MPIMWERVGCIATKGTLLCWHNKLALLARATDASVMIFLDSFSTIPLRSTPVALAWHADAPILAVGLECGRVLIVHLNAAPLELLPPADGACILAWPNMLYAAYKDGVYVCDPPHALKRVYDASNPILFTSSFLVCQTSVLLSETGTLVYESKGAPFVSADENSGALALVSSNGLVTLLKDGGVLHVKVSADLDAVPRWYISFCGDLVAVASVSGVRVLDFTNDECSVLEADKITSMHSNSTKLAVGSSKTFLWRKKNWERTSIDVEAVAIAFHKTCPLLAIAGCDNLFVYKNKKRTFACTLENCITNSRIYKFNGSCIDLDSSLNKVDANGDHYILYGNGTVQVYGLSDLKMFSSFGSEAMFVHLLDDEVLAVSCAVIEVFNLSGKLLKSVQVENAQHMFSSYKNGVLALVSMYSSCYLSLFKDLKPIGELICVESNVRDLQLNCNGTLLAILTNSLSIYSVEKEKIIGTLDCKKIYWDQLDSRLLFTKTTTINAFFVTDRIIPYTTQQKDGTLVAVQWPTLYFLKDKVYSTLAQEFKDLNISVDKEFVRGMLDFRIAIASGRRPIVPFKSKSWDAYARACIVSGNLDFALDCLGKANNAMACKAVRKYSDPQEKLAMLALYMGCTIEVNNELKSDWLRIQGKFDEALSVSDLICAKAVYYSKGRRHEALGEYEDAILNYEKSDNLARIPNISTSNPKWNALKQEAQGNYEEALQLYLLAKDNCSLVRVYCILGRINDALLIAQECSNVSAHVYLAKYFVAQSMFTEAVEHFTLAGRINRAVIVAQEHCLFDELLCLSLKCDLNTQINIAEYFSSKSQVEKAVSVYLKANKIEEALNLCFTSQNYTLVSEIAECILSSDLIDKNVILRCAELMEVHQKYQQAAELYVIANEHERAMQICTDKSVKMNAHLLESFPIASAAEMCMAQGLWDVAAKKFMQIGDKVGAMKALLKVGDADQVANFARVAGNTQVYVLAANFLQTQNWRENSSLLKHIITFYSKASAYERLCAFFEIYAQLEIDDYGCYQKALGALVEAKRQAERMDSSNPFKATKLVQIQKKVELVTRFSTAKTASPKESLQECALILKDPDINLIVRSGDVYALMIETYLKENMQHRAQEEYKHMLATIPVNAVTCYLNSDVLNLVDPGFAARVQTNTETVEEFIEIN